MNFLKNKIFALTGFLSIVSLFAGSEKILILTYSYNRPEFIEWQHKTFEKFLLDDYEMIVFNDADNVVMSSQIKSMCKNLILHVYLCLRIIKIIRQVDVIKKL